MRSSNIRLRRLIYYSAATSLMPADAALESAELQQIISVSQEKNTRLGVTGLLLLHDRWFLQVLEGPAAEVLGTYNHILEDRRHCQATVLSAGPVQRREFAEWGMCARRLSPTDEAIHLTLSLKGQFDPRQMSPAHALSLLRAVRAIHAKREARVAG